MKRTLSSTSVLKKTNFALGGQRRLIEERISSQKTPLMVAVRGRSLQLSVSGRTRACILRKSVLAPCKKGRMAKNCRNQIVIGKNGYRDDPIIANNQPPS